MMAEKTRTISGGDSESEIGHDIILFDNNSIMNSSQISNISNDSISHIIGSGGMAVSSGSITGVGGGGAGTNKNFNITHNITGVSSIYFSFFFY